MHVFSSSSVRSALAWNVWPAAENLQRWLWDLIEIGKPRHTLPCRPKRRTRPEAKLKLPAGLDDTWNISAVRQLPEAQAADAELAKKCPGTPAELATVMLPALEFRFPCVLDALCCG
jgi:hypothetical protein